MPGTSGPRPISLAAATAFGTAMAALLVIALFPIFPRHFNVEVGDDARSTVRAPRDASFVSQFLTEEKREQAAAAVPESRVFDQDVRSRQIEQYDQLTQQVTQARALTDEARKRAALNSLPLSARSIDAVIAMPEDRWQTVVQEGRRALTETLSVSLDDSAANEAKDTIDSRIAPEFAADEALLASDLVRPLIQTTLVVDQERTDEARDAAALSVAPERVTVARDDVIISEGSRVDEVALEKLSATGLLTASIEWRNVVAVVIVSALAGFVVAGYLYVLQPRGITSERQMIALAIVTMLPLLVAKFYLPIVLPDEDRQFLAYILPLAAAPILVAALLATDVALLIAAVVGALAAFISVLVPEDPLAQSVTALDTYRLVLVYGFAVVGGVYIVHRADRLNRYVWAGLAVTLAIFVVLAATWFMDADRTAEDFGWIALSAVVGGMGAGVIAAGVFVTAGAVFGVTTRVQLMELSQLNAPLLRRLQDEAPGTFHHSVIVGNLAERAADLVGADALLTRVGCYYHDIGKVLQPGMYIENQMGGPDGGQSPHDTMTPEESATTIKQHVHGGIELARRERLPARVQAFIPEHHGTRMVTYFYRKAAERDPEVDTSTFTYPGPRPQSKETAIVMLADSTEALIRSAPDRSPDRIDAMVEEVLAERVAEGQLDDSDLTLRDLRTIAESFKSTMRAVYHPRVQYPEPTPMETRRRTIRIPLLTNSTSEPAQPATPRRTRANR